MAIIENKVETWEIDLRCDKCGKGLMRWTGVQDSKLIAQFQHKCNHTDCDFTANCVHVYPMTETRLVL